MLHLPYSLSSTTPDLVLEYIEGGDLLDHIVAHAGLSKISSSPILKTILIWSLSGGANKGSHPPTLRRFEGMQLANLIRLILI